MARLPQDPPYNPAGDRWEPGNPTRGLRGMCRNDHGLDRMRSDRDRELLALKLASPMRSSAGCVVEDQADAGHLPLFVAASEPTLF